MEAILRVVEHFCSLQEADIFVVLKQSLCWCGSYFTGILCIVMYGKTEIVYAWLFHHMLKLVDWLKVDDH